MVMSAGNGFANPIREVIKEAYYVFGDKARVSCILSLGSGFRGVVALDDDRKNITQAVRMDCERVAQEVKESLAKSNVYYRLSVDRGLEEGLFVIDFGAMKSHVDDYLRRDVDMDKCIAASAKAGKISMEKICESVYLEMA
jgi:hypothetical protein